MTKKYKYTCEENGKQYSLKEAKALLEEIYDFLWINEEISFDTELKHKLQHANIIKASSYDYLIYKKFKEELQGFKKGIDEVLEFRKCKDKKMYPGIAAMALKNKHDWKDSKDLNHGGQENGIPIQIVDFSKYKDKNSDK